MLSTLVYIAMALEQCRAPSSLPPNSCIWGGVPGKSQISNHTLVSIDACCASCQSITDCQSWIAHGKAKICILRNIATTDGATGKNCQSGIVQAPPPPPPGPAPALAKNVLYLLSDDLRPEMHVAYSQRVAITPNLDKLAASGLTFAKAYCQQAVCGASRNSFMTGRRPHHTNVYGGDGGADFRKCGIDRNKMMGANWTTLPEHFKHHNYSVLGGGKTFHPGNPPKFDYQNGGGSWSAWPSGRAGGASSQDANYFDYFYWLTNKTTQVPYAGPCPGFAKPLNDSNGLAGPIAVWCALDEPDEHFYDEGLASDTIARLRYAANVTQADGSQRPFFIQSGFARPHTPWRVPQRFWDMYKTEDIPIAKHKLPPQDMPGAAWMAHSFFNATTGKVWPLDVHTPLDDDVARTARHAYYASVTWMDHQVGRILDELEALGLAENTLVVLHGDHGWQLGEHNSWHKYTNFELGTRVPLIMRAPWMKSSIGAVTFGLAELVDSYPTVAALVGAGSPTDALDGVSLVPFFEDPTRTSFPTATRLGTKNKTLAFSQYPHTDNGALVPGTACPFYDAAKGTCTASPSGQGNSNEKLKPKKVAWMGFSVRDQSYRYTAWLPFNGTLAIWDAEVIIEELYNHTASDGTDFDSMDTDNLAYRNDVTKAKAKAYFALVKEQFAVLAPPLGVPCKKTGP